MTKKQKLESLTDYSVKKYKKTYKALEKYDSGSKKKAKFLADREGLRDRFQQI